VVVTTFASNVARVRAIALAAAAAGRKVVLIGRAMERVVAVARDCGYLDDVAPFLSPESFSSLPRDEIVVLATGSQGESRAAMARISEDDHPIVRLAPGDKVIFSSRTIPGNERDVGRIINNLIRQGVEVITDGMALIHASGHPRRGEVSQFYKWLKPKIAIPAHGEELHLAEHAQFARDAGAEHVIKAHDGDVVLLAPGEPGIVDEAPVGRMAKDGNALIPIGDEILRMRQRLAVSGIITIALAVDKKGEMAGIPDVMLTGIPSQSGSGAKLDEVVDDALFQTFDGLPRPQRRWGMIIGAGVASILLIVFTGVVTTLMTLPYLKLVGGCALLWIAFRLLVGDAEEHHVEAVEDLWRAVRIVVVADIVMSLDNVIAVAAAAGGSYLLLGLGLTVSIPVVIAGAALIMALLGRFPVLVWAGAALLGWIAGGLIAEDPALRQFLPATGSLTFAPHSIIFGRSGGHGPEITVNPLELAFSLAGAVVVLAAALWSLRSRRSTATES